jgi:TonB family protein
MKRILYALTVVSLSVSLAIAQKSEVSGTPGTMGADGAYVVGNGVTTPSLLERVDPSIPGLAQKLRATGDVVFSVVVTSNGGVRDPQVIRRAGYGMDEEAARVVRKWRFKPAAKDGVPVDVRIRIEVGFRLQLDDRTWRAGPLVVDTDSGVTPPVLKSGTMPNRVKEEGNETVVLRFTINETGEVANIEPLQGRDSPSLEALTNSVSAWKFEPAFNGTERVAAAARVLLIKGEDQFRFNVSAGFH